MLKNLVFQIFYPLCTKYIRIYCFIPQGLLRESLFGFALLCVERNLESGVVRHCQTFAFPQFFVSLCLALFCFRVSSSFKFMKNKKNLKNFNCKVRIKMKLSLYFLTPQVRFTPNNFPRQVLL